MQPTYLPWLGFFDLIDQSQVFIFLDNVQFEKQSWQQRNRIRTSKGLEWLTIPSLIKGRSHQLINEVRINYSSNFAKRHLRALGMNYQRAPYLSNYFPELQAILNSEILSLCEFNISLIKWLSAVMGIQANFLRSSELEGQGKRASLLVNLCEKVLSNNYLSTYGSKDYLISEYDTFMGAGIEVRLHNYQHPEYRQLYSPFLPYASVIDLLLNEGERSLEIIRSGRREPIILTV
jgi:hypothetical protein